MPAPSYGIFKASRLTFESIDVPFIRPGVAVACASWSLTGDSRKRATGAWTECPLGIAAREIDKPPRTSVQEVAADEPGVRIWPTTAPAPGSPDTPVGGEPR